MVKLKPIVHNRESILDEDFEKAIETFLGYSDTFPKRFYKFREINKNTIHLLVKKQVYFCNIFSLNDPLECPFLQINKQLKDEVFIDHLEPKIFSLVAKEQDDKNTISSVVNNNLMFSHYADSHKGICIEYNLSFEKNFEQRKMFLTKAHYQDKLNYLNLRTLFSIKDKKWSYENEYRFVAFGEQSLYDLEGKITKILFGLKTNQEDITLIKKILSNQNIEFYQTKQKENSYFDFTFEKI